MVGVEQSKTGKVETEKDQKPILRQPTDSDGSPPRADPESVVGSEKEMADRSLSRAERRKRIKEQIMAGSEEAGFEGYRRRMW